MNNKKILFIVLVSFTLILTGTFSSAIKTSVNTGNYNSFQTKNMSSNEGIANWTLMHYLCCDNNHMGYIIDMKIENISRVGSTDDLNIIVAKDGVEYGDSAVYFIEKDNPVNINDIFNWPEEVDMGHPNTVKTFINLVKQYYPAKQYAIIFDTDFGSGWQGILRDTDGESKTGLPLMTIPEFADVFKEITKNGAEKIDIVALATCISGSYETAYELSPYVNYIVFSQEHMLEPLDKGAEYIFQYLDVTWYLKNNTNVKPEQYAKKMVELYNPCDFPLWVFYTYEIFAKKGEISPVLKLLSNILTEFLNNRKNPDYHIVGIHTTLSAINLSRINNVKNALNNLTSKLLLHINTENVKNSIDDARKNVRTYGNFYSKTQKISMLSHIFHIKKTAFDSYIDLYNLAELINESVNCSEIKDLCLNLMDEINNSVIKKTSMPNDDSHGYSIYFPKEKSLYNKYIWSDEKYPGYENLKFSEDSNWDDFLKTYLDI